MSEGFFSRWSRRKQEVAARASDGPLPPVPVQEAPLPAPMGGGPGGAEPGQPPVLTDQPTEQSLPTLEDVQGLTPQSDFQPFMQRGVGTEVRNAAMKKLFADPHFNVMDGLDVYIDDYSQPDPMPAGMLRQMASAQFLQLVPEEAPVRQAAPLTGPQPDPAPADGMQVVAQSPDSSAAVDPSTHDHPDLQLQPDDAAQRPGAEPGA